MTSLNTKIGIALGLALCCAPLPIAGDDWPWPKEREAISPSGAWSARLILDDPRTAGGFHPRMKLVGPSGLALVYPLINPTAPVDFAVLDDGTVVTCDEWYSRGTVNAVVVYEKGGRLVAAHSLEGLIKVKGYFPTSVSSTYWLRSPFDWQPAGTGPERAIALTLFNEDRLLIRLRDGQPRYQVVEDVGADAGRLLLRAKSLHPGDEVVEKVALLRRALALDAEMAPVYLELADALCETSRKSCEESVSLLDQGLLKFPPKACGGCSDPGLWMATYKGRNLAKLGRLAEAQAELRRALAIDPAFDAASGSLANLAANPRPETFPEEEDPRVRKIWGNSITRQEFLRRALGDADPR